ncbi:hypothetical protein BDR06DRAFT_1014243 [Suillus hirtellus]|nr:hypothetical protein BDR06DRAFT_1014243 [Suillus hirtellus]
MAVVSNDPTWWPVINAFRVLGYFLVAAFIGVTYDWALTFGQEVEFVWAKTTLVPNDSSVPQCALPWILICCLVHVELCSDHLDASDRYGTIIYVVWSWIGVVVFAMVWVIIITRLYAMYQGSRNILIFLIVIFLAINIFDGVAVVISMMHISGEELILSGTYQCSIGYPENVLLLDSISWILGTVWEVFALCLALWIAVKHFHELRRHLERGIIEDCFTVVGHGSFFAVSCLQLIIDLSPTLSTDQNYLESLYGLVQVLEVVQMFVLGPRLILSVREYNAKVVANSDAATTMTSIAFQERVHILTSSSV